MRFRCHWRPVLMSMMIKSSVFACCSTDGVCPAVSPSYRGLLCSCVTGRLGHRDCMALPRIGKLVCVIGC